ncbi:hypothetical protein [Caulobacter sp. Root655]|uniref:hypothetical protein n=1 Tax=Caulobacter sp. Root655 TaxID=1736578 RepID=UPI0012E38A0C|nr:hypothetical protein [Caulobacter sp. Root655]
MTATICAVVGLSDGPVRQRPGRLGHHPGQLASFLCPGPLGFITVDYDAFRAASQFDRFNDSAPAVASAATALPPTCRFFATHGRGGTEGKCKLFTRILLTTLLNVSFALSHLQETAGIGHEREKIRQARDH